MKGKWLLAGGIVAAVTMIGASYLVPAKSAHAQQNSWPVIRVACIDVKEVFKNYKKFDDMKSTLESLVNKHKESMMAKQKMAQGKAASLKSISNPADRELIERELTTMKFDMEKAHQKFQVDMVKQQTAMQATIYAEMQELVEKYAKTHGIHLVLRLNNVPHDAADPRTMAMYEGERLRRSVIYSHGGIDITKVIADGLNSQLPVASKPGKTTR